MISEKVVRAWIEETRQSYADLALEYRERNMNGEQFHDFNEMAASGCDSAASALTLLLENFDQRLISDGATNLRVADMSQEDCDLFLMALDLIGWSYDDMEAQEHYLEFRRAMFNSKFDCGRDC